MKQRNPIPISWIERACLRMLEAFHLQFAAVDLVVTEEGDSIFLEQNANGQWRWIEEATGQPLTHALVDLLDSSV